MKKIYRVWQESGEARTKRDEKWTAQEVLDDYNSLNQYNTQTLNEFSTEQQAMDYYNSISPMMAFKQAANWCYVLLYEVIGVDEVEIDDNGEEMGAYQIAIKTEGTKGE